jgi:cellulose synthase operon protein YhjQ
MGSRGTEIDGQPLADGTPEDVAVLYSWANLQGAKYRDYSASRREYRAQIRYRAARALLERELKAQEDAEASAAETGRVALTAEATDRSPSKSESPAGRSHSQQNADEAARKVAADRVEAARRAEAVAHAAVLALREEREISEAHSSATRKAQLYEESGQRRRQLAGPQPRFSRDGRFAAPAESSGDGDSALLQQLPESLHSTPSLPASPRPALQPEYEEVPFDPAFGSDILGPFSHSAALDSLRAGDSDRTASSSEFGPTGPAWLYASQTPPQVRVLLQAVSTSPAHDLAPADTLQDSRERVAARWFALKGVFENRGLELPAMQPQTTTGAGPRVLAVFSLAGGVGKTSLVATLGRALSSMGEKVVLADTTSQGLLPIHFGVREVRPGVVATCSPPQSAAQPISMFNCDLTGKGELESGQELIAEEILRNGQDHHRMLLDLSTASSWLVRRMADLHPTVLVPMTPDMNSVLSLLAVERLFRSITDSGGRPLLPFYILNQFEASLPLHLDVREVLRRQLGERLLRTVIGRSPAISEALAQGMTVLDYAPDASVSQDYIEVAAWLRSVSPPATAEVRATLRGDR